MDSRPFRPPDASNAGSSCAAAAMESSSTAFQPIQDSPAVGCSSAISRMRGTQVSGSCWMQVYAITGLQVAPTAPYSWMAVDSSRGSAESFHRAVGVCSAACRVTGRESASVDACVSRVVVIGGVPS
ncbi:hypothetical protein WDV91_04570 [Curtobacterium flaccumfaciens pv. flaccumfaciens]